jgi:hypothetical protein
MCFGGVNMQSPEQYDKLQRVFRAILKFEHANRRFQWVVRLRTGARIHAAAPRTRFHRSLLRRCCQPQRLARIISPLHDRLLPHE